MKKIILLTTPFALFAMSAVAATYNATLQNESALWSDEGIWDAAPNAEGSVSISGESAAESVLTLNTNITDTGGHNTTVSNATLKLEGSSENLAGINFGSNGGLVLNDASFSSTYGDIQFGNFNRIDASGASSLYFGEGTTFSSGAYSNIRLADTAQMTVDGITYQKQMWNNSTTYNLFEGSSVLTIQNAATFGYWDAWGGGSNEVIFNGNAALNILSGSTFIGHNTKLVMNDNTVATVTGESSNLNSTYIQLNGSSKINVSDGGTVALTNVEINDGASINFLSDFTYSSATISATGTSATINVDGVKMTRGNNAITVGGNTVLNFKNGATFSLGHTNGLTIADSAKVVFDSSYIEYLTFPVVTATGGELIFKNNSGISPTASYNFGRYDFSGNAKMTIDSSTLSSNFHSNSGYVFDFSDTAELNIQNGGSLIYQNGYNYAIRLQNSAKLNVSGGSTMTFTGNTERKIEILGSSSVNIGSGANNVSLGPVTMEEGASFNVSGSENTITLTSLSSAGTFKFISDENGISKITTNEITDMSGMLILDFSKFLGEELTAAIITTADIFTFDDYIGTNESGLEKVDVITRNAGDTWDIYFEDGTLMIAYTAVPEPATYAAIFGALVLGLAIYKRQKNGQERQ